MGQDEGSKGTNKGLWFVLIVSLFMNVALILMLMNASRVITNSGELLLRMMENAKSS